MTEEQRPPRGNLAVWLLSTALAVGGGALLFAHPTQPPLPLWSLPVAVAVLAAGFALAESFVVHLPIGRQVQSFSVGEVPLLVGLFVVAPWAVAAARVVGVGTALLRLRVAPLKVVFTVALFILETAIAATVWSTILGTADPLGPQGWLAALAAVAVGDITSGMLLALALRLHEGALEPGAFREAIVSGLVPALANGALALTVVFVAATDWRALWLPGIVVAVLFFAHRATLVLRRRHDALQRLNQFTGDVAGHLKVDDVAAEVLAQVRAQLHADAAQLTMRDQHGADRTWHTGHDLDVFAGGDAPLLVPQSTRNAAEQRLLSMGGVKDAVSVPLPGDAGTVGTVVVANHVGDYDTFTGDDVEVLQALANHAAGALRNAELADQLRRQVAENEHRALHDALTDLPNRRLFAQRIAEVDRPVAVLMLDLDGFKEVNDALGHATGDVLLRLVAQRLVAVLPDARCVARTGGDEFVIALDVDAVEAGAETGVRVREALFAPFALPDMTLSIDASIGVAFGDGTTAAGELLKQADVAMYDAKTSRAGVRVYDADRDRSSPERLLLPNELREAIARGGLTVHYQPKVTLSSEAVEGFEALVRWQHPTRGMVPPDEFIPMAEHTGLIADLTYVVLDAALAECRRWRDTGQDVSVAVNLSPRVLHDERFVERLATALAEAEVPSSALTLEITESALMADPSRGEVVLSLLADMGVTLSVDDLGTGYSSLAHLKRLPVHEVKIDRSFVMGMDGDSDDAAIVEAVVALGHRMGKRVVAEGVENDEIYRRLRGMGCDVAQGYGISRPMPAEDAYAWLLASRPRLAVGAG